MFHRVLIAGMGALGSEVALNLGLLGCESVFLADADLLEPKNIARSRLLREGGIAGHTKISCALDRLRSWFPQICWAGAEAEIADVEPEQFLQADLLFSCVDTDLARTEIAALAAHYQLPVCDAGLGGTSVRMGRVSWFPGMRSAACFACLLSNKRRAALLSSWESDIHACWARDRDDDRKEWTSTATMASIVAGIQIEVALSAAAGAGEAFSVHLDLDQTPISQTVSHRRSADCPLHAGAAGAIFPVCTLAKCRTCNDHFAPNRRVGWLRRWGSCPFCGSRDLIIGESVRGELAGSSA